MLPIIYGSDITKIYLELDKIEKDNPIYTNFIKNQLGKHRIIILVNFIDFIKIKSNSSI